MIQQLHAAWRARRVLLIGSADRMTLFMDALLSELGAKTARAAPPCKAETLHLALSQGRISAVIVPSMRALAAGGVQEALAALSTLLAELREAGVPLAIFLSDDSVYRASGGPWYAQESDPIGGETAQGLTESILELYADGVSRGLLGDPVRALCVRHLPCLGCGHPAAAPYSAWCRAAAGNLALSVPHPGAQGVFVHPLDACCGALLLGARFFLGDAACCGAFNLGICPQNLTANRSAALRFASAHHLTQPLREIEPPGAIVLPIPDGARARLLCGARCLIPGEEALEQLYALEQADGFEAMQQEMLVQTRAYLERLCGQ